MKPHPTPVVRLSIFIVVLLVAVGGFWIWWNDAISPANGADTEPVVFVIQNGEGVKSIINRLEEQDLIRSPTAFYILVKFMGIEKDLQAGGFRLQPSMDAKTVASELTHGYFDIWVTTLEGWRNEEVATQLVKDLDIPEAEFLKVAKEGYMFPDTYQIARDATAGAIAKVFLSNFEKKLTPTLKQDSTKQGLTLDEVIILASIVEREGRTDEDRPYIAGILLKRLRADWPLQTDATLQYALGYQSQEKTWWKKFLTAEDKLINSPFNTYENTGLPPTPISNPGVDSILAVIYPKDSDYWFYLHDPKGEVHYGVTLEDHSANIEKFLR